MSEQKVIGSVMVIGGGVAGVQSAVGFGGLGGFVFFVGRLSALGGGGVGVGENTSAHPPPPGDNSPPPGGGGRRPQHQQL